MIRKLILPVIVFSQFCCTSLWFASNAVLNDLVARFGLESGALGHLTSAVQFGFISGTLLFAVLTVADRFSPSKVFLISAILGSASNLGVVLDGNGLWSLLSLRFTTGFFLAGIYPVGMKIAADHYEKGLGRSLGFLVGALVLGTAFPHMLKEIADNLPWRIVMIATSSLAVLGGILMVVLVPDGPYRQPVQRTNLSAFFSVFKNRKFRSAAFGYFGHMWELYAYWAFIPFILKMYVIAHTEVTINIPLWSFLIIASGGPACVLGASIAKTIGIKKMASIALLLSGLCCLLSPWMFTIELSSVFIAFLVFWGMVVITDSPLLSTLVAKNAPVELKGTALTIVNCIGFATTIVSIQLINGWLEYVNSSHAYMLLALGPVVGLIALNRTGIGGLFGKK